MGGLISLSLCVDLPAFNKKLISPTSRVIATTRTGWFSREALTLINISNPTGKINGLSGVISTPVIDVVFSDEMSTSSAGTVVLPISIQNLEIVAAAKLFMILNEKLLAVLLKLSGTIIFLRMNSGTDICYPFSIV